MTYNGKDGTGDNPDKTAPPFINIEDDPEIHQVDPNLLGNRTIDHIQGTSDDTLAVGFADAFHSKLRFVYKWNRWMVWDGTRWDFDDMLYAYKHARLHLRDIAKSISDKLYKARLQEISPMQSDDVIASKRKDARAESRRAVKHLISSRTIHNIATLTRSDQRIASSVNQWDKDPYMLNTPGGTVNLRTGELLKHNPYNYITHITAVGPATGEPSLWLGFLRTVMNGDESMVRYLQKIFGYCLVGDTKEHEMYFAYGTGGNGKGVMLNTIRSIMGAYGVEANIETFIINQSQQHPTELAALRGARLVTCGETDEGQRWAEARIKKMTGGDPIRARFMRQDEFEYMPQFKLFLAGNHKPRLSNVDEAIKRRFRLIPFTFKINKSDRDLDLAEKLKAEWPQILNWAIEGCVLWQNEGLTPPAAVAVATESYLSHEDALSAWWNESCISDAGAFTTNQALYDSWVKWAQMSGEAYGTKRKLVTALEDREPVLGIVRTRRSAGWGFTGVELARPAASDE